MSMPMLVGDEEDRARPIAPMLRLADDVVDEYAATEDASTSPALRVVDGRLIADDGAVLPAMCVVCGDTVGAISLVAPRGWIGFTLCREHAMHSIARLVAGAGVVVIAAGLFVKGDDGVASRLALFAFLATIGTAVAASASPFWTWRAKDGVRRLFRVHREVRAAIERAAR